jgi:Predicted O-methyltransferase
VGHKEVRAELENLPVCEPHGRHWFWHGEQVLDLLDIHRPRVCVELGTWKGCSAIAVARLVRKWGGNVTCVDVWEQENVMGDFTPVTISECMRNMAAAGVSASVRLLPARTTHAARHWHGWIDYLYVDAGHSFEDCTQDLELWWPHVRVGGLIAGDDYGDPRQGVTESWDLFELNHGQRFERGEEIRDAYPGARLIWGMKR